jgi:hypothetical protein
VQGEILPKATCAVEASRQGRVAAKVISTPEVLISGDVAQWTRVAYSFMGHENIYKLKGTAMTP